MHRNDLQRSFRRDRTHDVRSPGLSVGFHTGVVIGNLEPNKLVIVRPDGQFKTVTCIWAAGIVSGLLGFKVSYLPPQDTRVGFYYTGQMYSFIVGSYDDVVPFLGVTNAITDPNGAPVASQEVYTSQDDKTARMANSHAQPVDLLEGEIDISNLMGVGISLLRNMASIQASDLSRVECLLLDDVVRIISQNFRHHSAFGDFTIANDGGRLSVEWNGTSHDFEAWGLKRPGDAKAKLEDQESHVEMRDSLDGYTDDGRWRFSQYVGWLGDFVNVFVTDPVDAIGRLASDQLRSGKARVHINNDGAVLVQSVADIVLEKVVRIPVPVRIRRTEDPAGNRSDDSPRNKAPLVQWKPGDNLFEMAFQLREYARWLNSQHSLARFKQMERDFRVPSEADTPIPQLTSSEQDKEEVNWGGGQVVNNWALGYSCIRIYRDGSVQTVDAYGNSMLTSAIGVQISSTQDILLQAAGSVNIVAGRDINLLAQKNVGITSVLKKVRLKAKEGIWNLVQSGLFLIDFAGSSIGTVFMRNSRMNVNNKLTVKSDGSLDTNGLVTALQVLATSTDIKDDHTGHLFIGTPAPSNNGEKFEFQEDYGDVPLYQTHAQSVLGRGEQNSDASWNFSDNVVPGVTGAPWPGAGKQEKKLAADAGSDLNVPTAQEPTAQPKTMSNANIALKVQS